MVSPMTSTLPASTTPSILASSWLTTESRTCGVRENDARLHAGLGVQGHRLGAQGCRLGAQGYRMGVGLTTKVARPRRVAGERAALPRHRVHLIEDDDMQRRAVSRRGVLGLVRVRLELRLGLGFGLRSCPCR